MKYFVIPVSSPWSSLHTFFATTFPFPSQPTLAAVAAAAGLNKPGKIIKIQANDETLAAKRP